MYKKILVIATVSTGVGAPNFKTDVLLATPSFVPNRIYVQLHQSFGFDFMGSMENKKRGKI